MHADILLADFVSIEAKTNVVGAFQILFADAFPAQHARMHAYIRLHRGGEKVTGKLKLTGKILQVGSATEEREIHSFDHEIVFPDDAGQGTVYQINAIMDGLVFPEPGTYCCRILADGEAIGQADFSLKRAG